MMTQVACPGCQWTVRFPEPLDDAIAACPECGQCLRAPAPWANDEIRPCNTRHLVGPAFGHDNRTTSLSTAPLVPLELTGRFPATVHQKISRRITTGLLGMAMGIGAVVMSLIGDTGGKLGTPLGRLFEGVVGVMMVLGGGLLIGAAIRKHRRQSRARVVRLPDTFPSEGYRMGTPVALHQAGSFGRVATVLAGLFVLAMGAICVAMIVRKELTDHRFVGLAFAAPITGSCFLWRGLRNHGVRVLVFPEGLIVFRHHRAEVWRWDEIDGVYLKPDSVARPALVHVVTLRRQDGERLVFNSGLEYLENQLGVRIQYEMCRRLLPRFQEALRAGATLDFGPLQVNREGIQKNHEVCCWNELAGVGLTADGLAIRKQEADGRPKQWVLPLAQVPNAAVFLALAQANRELEPATTPLAFRARAEAPNATREQRR